MDDNEKNNTTQPEAKEKFDLQKFITAKYAEYTSEFKKIIWPTRKVLIKQTFTVAVVSLVFGFIIFCMDTVFNLGVQLFVGLIG